MKSETSRVAFLRLSLYRFLFHFTPVTCHLIKCAFFVISCDFYSYREKIEDYLRFLTHAGETRFPIFACGNLGKLCHFVARLSGVLTLTM